MNSKSKSNLLLGILLMSLLTMFIVGCSKDSNEPIQLHYSIYNDKPNPVTGNQVLILFPTSEKTQLVVSGGDGNFAITNSDKTIIDVSINDRLIDITPLSTGDAFVSITDKSDNLYVFSVKVYYKEYNLMVDKQDVIVIGDKLSEVQKTEIQQKAILTLPVKVNGGFKLVYNEGDQASKGEAYIYKDNYGVEPVKSVFEFKRVKIEANGVIQNYNVFVITIDGKKREFVMNKYIALKSSGDMMVPMALHEVLTEQFKTDYPDVEWVYTQQRIKLGGK